MLNRNSKEEFERYQEVLKKQKEDDDLEQLELEKRIRFVSSHVPEHALTRRTFSKFDVSRVKNGQVIMDSLKLFINPNIPHNDSPCFFTLYGDTGTGKSHLALASCIELVENYNVFYWHVPELLEYLTKAQFDNTYFSYMEQLIDSYLLVLDDYGNQYATDFKTEKLDILINSRYDNGRLTIVTTNKDLVELTKLNQRVASRLMSGYHAKLDAQDFRIEYAKSRKIG